LEENIMAFTIDRVRRITSYAAANKLADDNHGVAVNIGDILYTIKDVSNFSISNSAETVDAVDGLGNVIDTYLRSKTAEMSGENAIFDLPLAATMAGTKVAAGEVDINFHDVLTVAKGATEVTLSKTPKAGLEPTVVYVVNGDGTLGEKLEATTGFNYADGKVTLVNKIVDKDGNEVAGNIFVPYTYTEAGATKFENFADAATIPSRVVVEGLGRDVCDHHQVYFYITAPYAELSYDNEFGFATDSTYSFTLNCKKPYCSEDGLYAVIVVDAE
jgi:hypothetical protein